MKLDISHSIIHEYDEILNWLYENVGAETAKYRLTSPIVREGDGWEIQTHQEVTETHTMISWHLVIEDERKGVLFALKFGLS
jgi:hypothetical protein